MSIPELGGTFKERLAEAVRSDIGLIVALLAVGLVSFFCGYMAARAPAERPTPVGQGSLGAAAVTSPSEPLAASEEVVASKKGTTYHLPWCSGAKSIKEENRITFESPAAAKAAGYRPAGNCKGLE